MKLDKLINELISLRKEHGDIEVFDENLYPIDSILFENDFEEYPEEYNMPKEGWLRVKSD